MERGDVPLGRQCQRQHHENCRDGHSSHHVQHDQNRHTLENDRELGDNQNLNNIDNEDIDNEDTEEQEHFQQVCRSYQQYATFHQTAQQGVRHRISKLLESSQGSEARSQSLLEKHGPTVQSILPPSVLPQTPQHAQSQKLFCEATIRNQFFLDNILKYSGVLTSQEVIRELKRSGGQNGSSNRLAMNWVTEEQMSKVNSVLKSVARDWSEEGKAERDVAYSRILDALDTYLPIATEESPRVAVPGSGLGRLAWEIFSKGYSVQGSDFSLPMLLASDFMLNGCSLPDSMEEDDGDEKSKDESNQSSTTRQFTISPWLSETKNVTSFQNRIRPVIVPDVNPTSLEYQTKDGSLLAPEFTMLAGEFLSLYGHFLPSSTDQSSSCDTSHMPTSKKFHAIASSFFLDTAPSLPNYLITIYHMLEKGGLLINFGPLMYHWSGHGALLPSDCSSPLSGQDHDQTSMKYKSRNAYLDSRYLTSIDYTWEEVRHMILQCGFEILEEETNISARYTSDCEGMMKTVYDCVFLVARKKPWKE